MKPVSLSKSFLGVILALPLAFVALSSLVSPVASAQQCPICAAAAAPSTPAAQPPMCPMMRGMGAGMGMAPGAGMGPGMGMGMGMGMGGMNMPGMNMGGAVDDMTAIHELFANVNDIRRDVKQLPNGVETVTESDKPDVAALIQKHVPSMSARLEEIQPLHMRDPLFRELFRNAEKITMKVEPTGKGVKVLETSDDPWTAALIKAHADVVSNFIKNGHAEAMKNHELPARP